MKKYLLAAIALFTFTGWAFAQQTTTEAKPGWLGVEIQELNPALRIALGVEHGVLVTGVIEDSPAEKAGLKIGDLILALDGEKITDYPTLRRFIRQHPDQAVKITILRTGKKLELEVSLAARLTAKVIGPVRASFLKSWQDFLKQYDELHPDYQRQLEQARKELEELKKELKAIKKRLQDKGI